MKCPKCGTEINAAREFARLGGSVTSAKKKAAARANALKGWAKRKQKKEQSHEA
jgi:hypothetical protein